MVDQGMHPWSPPEKGAFSFFWIFMSHFQKNSLQVGNTTGIQCHLTFDSVIKDSGLL